MDYSVDLGKGFYNIGLNTIPVTVMKRGSFKGEQAYQIVFPKGTVRNINHKDPSGTQILFNTSDEAQKAITVPWDEVLDTATGEVKKVIVTV